MVKNKNSRMIFIRGFLFFKKSFLSLFTVHKTRIDNLYELVSKRRLKRLKISFKRLLHKNYYKVKYSTLFSINLYL